MSGPTCPHCEAKLTPQEVKSLWGSYTSGLAAPHGGRKRDPKRCKCGVMTAKRAKARNHKCQ